MKYAAFCLIGAMLINSLCSTALHAQFGGGGPPENSRIQVFVLKHAPAIDTGNIVVSVFESNNYLTVAPDSVGNRLVIRSDEQTIKQIGELLKELDQPSQNAAIRSTAALPFEEPAARSSHFGLHGKGYPGAEIRHIQATNLPPSIAVRPIVAAVDGEVTKILVKDNDEVKEGAVLVEMDNPDLEASIRHTEAKRRVAQMELDLMKRANGDAPGRIAKTEMEKLEASLNVIDTELAVAQLQKQKLTVISPIAGRVVGSNLHDRLIKCYMKKGDVLLTLALPGQPFTLALPNGNATWTAAASVPPPVVGIQARRANAQALHEDLLDRRNRAIWKDQYIELSASRDADRDQKLAELKKEIHIKLTKSFDERQAKQTKRVEELEKRLSTLKSAIEKQEANRDVTIAEQVNEIVGSTPAAE